ncbi:hypothetical protein COCNU_12G004070 [Cocos nucifera]|uniref:Uncharacterized protein n=1 Tax=Cocos nucifera TaxID=13894 RepID=A0A8K0IRC0_COCNU|nr:hypothetical protein COCNU_12G004070 [Cocos nucifera]
MLFFTLTRTHGCTTQERTDSGMTKILSSHRKRGEHQPQIPSADPRPTNIMYARVEVRPPALKCGLLSS